MQRVSISRAVTGGLIAFSLGLALLTPLSASADVTLTTVKTICPSSSCTINASSGTYTPPGNVSYVVVEVWGSGGGGGASNGGTTGQGGNSTCFGTNSSACTSPLASASGGTGGTGGGAGIAGGGGAGGAGSVGDVKIGGGGGSSGSTGPTGAVGTGGAGGSAARGGGGGAGGGYAAGGANGYGFGGGGGGAGTTDKFGGGGGGGAGGYAQVTLLAPAGSYNYSVGAGGAGGTPGSYAGGAGGAGGIVIYEYTSNAPTRAFTGNWTGPTSGGSCGTAGGVPPTCNVAAPINTGSAKQTKTGDFWTTGALVGNNVTSNQYCIGVSCISSWSQAGSPNQWTSSGSNIYYNSGSVGIGVTNPTGKLDLYVSANPGLWHILSFSNSSPEGYGFIGVNNTDSPYPLVLQLASGRPFGILGGSVGIGNQFPGYTLDVSGSVGAGAYYYYSDARLKKNIQTLTDSLSKIMQLRPVTFNWIDPSAATTTQLGFIAQEVEKVVPELVSTNATTTIKAVDYARITPLLVGAAQEQEQKIDAQQKQIDAQQKEIDELEAQVQALTGR